LRAALTPDGRVQIHPHQGSGVLMSAAWADGLVDVAPGQVIQPGDVVRFMPLPYLMQPPGVLTPAMEGAA
jgi:molybdopterin molybdotransferase